MIPETWVTLVMEKIDRYYGAKECFDRVKEEPLDGVRTVYQFEMLAARLDVLRTLRRGP